MSIEAVLAKYGLFALFLGAGIEGETVAIAGGLVAHRGIWSLPGAMAASAAGSFVADQVFFSVGRYFRGSGWVRRLHARPVFARALGWLERYPIGFIFAFRFVYGFRTVSPVAIGTTQVTTRLFVLINLAAAIVWGVTFSTIGYLFGHGFEVLLGRILPSGHALLIAAGVVVAAGAAWGGVRWWRRKKEAR
jgi:membrane protein DedA with SNARE-associated domain